ncbi:hypothetical protein D7O18_25895 [Salmonella enterica subsp. enterica serovar Muenchen]|nr:hypothetical protein [Salmonella enterica subsp. enterica serovar Muenchen]
MTMTVITDAKNGRYGENDTIMADVRFDDLTAADGTPLYLPYTANRVYLQTSQIINYVLGVKSQ